MSSIERPQSDQYEIWKDRYECVFSIRQPSAGIDYQEVYRHYVDVIHNRSPDYILEYAANNGYEKLIRSSIEQGARKFLFPMIRAAANGHLHVLETIMQTWNAPLTDLNIIMAYAAGWGHIQMVKRLLQLGARDYNSGMKAAAQGGHRDIVHLMVDNGAKDYNSAMMAAAIGNRLDIVELMITLGANNYDLVMTCAATDGYINIVRRMLQVGATGYDVTMVNAAAGGYHDIVELMLQHGVSRINEALSAAMTSYDIRTVEVLLVYGADNIYEVMGYTTCSEIKDFLKHWVAKKEKLQ